MCCFHFIVPGVSLLQVPFHDGNYRTGVALVNCEDHWALIDSGECSKTVDTHILPALRNANVDQLDCILCTHNHGDHTGGHARLREVLRRPIYVYDADADHFPTPVDDVLHDGDRPIPGLRLIATPGHTHHAVSFLHEKSGTLITGDSFQGSGTDGVGLALIEDISSYRESIHRIMVLNVQRIIAGHGFAPYDFVIEGPMRVRAFLQYCLNTSIRYEQFIALHADMEESALTSLLVELEGRIRDNYIVRGDATIGSYKRYLHMK